MALEAPELAARYGSPRPAADEVAGRSSVRYWLRLAGTWWPAALLAFMLLFCFVWPLVYSLPNPNYGNLGQVTLPPLSPGHILGTDQLGNDELSRALYGGRVSIVVSVCAVVIGMVIGTVIGVLAGYLGRAVEVTLMRVLDVFLAVPSLALSMVIVTYLGPSESHVIWAISFFTMPGFGRLARAATLRLRERSFIVASRLSGTSRVRLMLRHIVPNIFPPLLTYGLLMVGTAIMIETSLSFLGLGIPEPQPSWGNMVGDGQTLLSTQPYLVVIPVIFIFVTVLSINLLGDTLRSRWSQE
jgi:peptide/nickel transport system permease protein